MRQGISMDNKLFLPDLDLDLASMKIYHYICHCSVELRKTVELDKLPCPTRCICVVFKACLICFMLYSPCDTVTWWTQCSCVFVVCVNKPKTWVLTGYTPYSESKLITIVMLWSFYCNLDLDHDLCVDWMIVEILSRS